MTTKELKTALEEENAKTREILLSLDCGEIQPESLPMNPKYYITKKERLEALIWILEIEGHLLKEDATT